MFGAADRWSDAERGETDTGTVGGGVIACLRCEPSNLRAIKRCGWPTALRCAF